MPRTASSSTAPPINSWRGIIRDLRDHVIEPLCDSGDLRTETLKCPMTRSQNCLISWSGSELRANGDDPVGHGTGDALLIVRRSQLREIGCRRRDFDRYSRCNNIIQRAERRSERPHADLLLSQLRCHTGNGGLTERGGRLLGSGPGTERATVFLATVRKQRCVKANAVAVRGGMQRDINGGVRCVGEKGALIEG